MIVDRTLDDAHRLLSQGKVDGAIAAYAGLIESRPDDWPAANRLGDLYLQAGKIDEALEQFNQVAQHLSDHHLLPKAAAVYKKMLKVAPHDEYARLQLADISEQRGFLVEARTHLDVVMGLRRDGDDTAGAEEIAERLRRLGGSRVEPGGEPAPMAAAAQQSDTWEVDRTLLFDRDAEEPPTEATDTATAPAGSARASAEPSGETDKPTAQDRQLQLKMMLIENEFRASRFKRAGQLMSTMLSASSDGTAQVLDLAKRIAVEQPEATVICAEVLLEAAAEHDDWRSMTSAIAELSTWAESQPETSQWPAELTERLERAESSGLLEMTRRGRDGAPALPAIENGGAEHRMADAPQEPAVAAAV